MATLKLLMLNKFETNKKKYTDGYQKVKHWYNDKNIDGNAFHMDIYSELL